MTGSVPSGGRPGVRGLLPIVATLLLLLPSGAAAQLTLWEGGAGSLGLGGYARTLSGVDRAALRVPGESPTRGFNAEVLRLEWDLRLGEGLILQLHDKVQLQVTSAGGGAALAGFGVSAVPDRSVDLRRDFIDRERVRAWHDVDRLALTAYTGVGDVTVGRQAITWGISSLFPVADLWSRFSPFELDTEEKPGIDAVRWLSYPGSGWELDAVLADRGSREDLSVGIRGSLSLPWTDLWVGGGKLWREAMLMGGIATPLGSWKLRGEAVFPYDLDEDGWDRARVTLGADWLSGGLLVTGEYHHNGVGASGAEGYAAVLADPRFQRGESYYLGRHYLGALVSWSPGNDRLTLSLSGLANLQDPSTAWTPVATYDLGQSTRISLGGVLTTGDAPAGGTPPRLRSEYGTYGDLGFTRVSIYF